MKLLIAVDNSRFFYLRQFGDELTKNGIEYKLVYDLGIYDNSLNAKKYLRWMIKPNKFNQLIEEYKPDAVFTERAGHFGLLTLKQKIPLFLYLRGDYWSEVKWAKKTIHKSLDMHLELWLKERIAGKCFKNSSMILPICRYLENIVRLRYPNKIIETLYQGINSSDWYPTKGMNLKHPCVGLLQGATIWGKTKEMLILPKVLEAMPDVKFYWVGDGPYRNDILPILSKYENFKWLGALSYPDGVRDYLSEIDVYALVSGLDMSPHTILEAQLMEKPVVATNVGGIPESMVDGKTGFLVEIGDYNDWIKKLSILINNNKKAKQTGMNGYNFVKENFSWDKIARRFIQTLNIHLGNQQSTKFSL